MVTSESSAQAPAGWDDVHERRLQASWNLDIETLILSLCHIRHQQGLQPEWTPLPSVPAPTTSAQAAAAHPVTLSDAVSPGDVPLALEDSFTGTSAHDGIVQPVRNAVFSPGDEVPDDGSISGSEDFGDDGVGKLELPRSDSEESATSQRRKLFEGFDRCTQTSPFPNPFPVVSQPPEVETTSYFVDGFSMSGAVRSGIHPVTHTGVQCSPESKDASCFASFSPDIPPSHTLLSAVEVLDVTGIPPPHPAHLHDVIAQQLKVRLASF
jgi:hypothetical protein